MDGDKMPVARSWPAAGPSRIPLWIYSDPELYAREMERLFYGPHWNYVGLEVELPGIGDFKTTVVGEKPVVVIRGATGEISVVENRCAHRGVKLCQRAFGTV